MKILFIGDLVSPNSIIVVEKALRQLRQEREIDLVIANGENIHAHNGISEQQFRNLVHAGADIVTLGNHTWDQKQVYQFIDDERLVRPFNYPKNTPGSGFRVIEACHRQVAVVAAMGNVHVSNLESPFIGIDALLEGLKEEGIRHIIVDIHAEATAEKLAFGHYLKGKVSAVLGTHTHVATADTTILEGGTGYQTDVGMVGPLASVIGMEIERSIARFVTQRRVNYKQAEDDTYEFNACLMTLDKENGQCLEIERICEKVTL